MVSMEGGIKGRREGGTDGVVGRRGRTGGREEGREGGKKGFRHNAHYAHKHASRC